MKYAIFGDIHGRNLTKLEERLKKENPDSIVCLGDFDSTDSIKQFKNMEKRYLKEGREVIKVPGNHDYAAIKNTPIESGTMMVQGKTSYQIYQEMIKDKEAYEYLKDLITSDFAIKGYLDEKNLGKEYPFVVIHGAHAGDLKDFSGGPKEIRSLWYRLKSEKDFSRNFEEMEKKGEKIMIRGHDHFQFYSYKKGEKEESNLALKGHKFELSKDKLHIINPGALFYGDFATIETSPNKEPLVNYHKL